MNILNVGSKGLVAALRAKGHRLFTVSSMDADADLHLAHPLTLNRLLSALGDFKPDLLFWCDDGNLPQLAGLEAIDCPSVFYSVDTFCNPWHIPFAQAFDVVLVAQKDHLRLFEQAGLRPLWLPLFYSGRVEIQEERSWLDARQTQAAFVGTLNPKNIPERLPFLNQVNAFFPLRFEQGAFDPIFRTARIVLNQSAVGELNYRCFEAMGCGAALLHDSEMEGFGDLFSSGVNVLPSYTHGSAAEAAAMLKFWSARPERLAAIARAGCELVASAHTVDIRAGQLLELALPLLLSQTWLERLRDLDRRKRLLSSAYAILALELPPELGAHKNFYLQLAGGLYPEAGHE